MKTRLCVLALCTLGLASCETPAPQDGSSYYYASNNQRVLLARPAGTSAASSSTPVPRGG
jgi:hypothetical protein